MNADERRLKTHTFDGLSPASAPCSFERLNADPILYCPAAGTGCSFCAEGPDYREYRLRADVRGAGERSRLRPIAVRRGSGGSFDEAELCDAEFEDFVCPAGRA